MSDCEHLDWASGTGCYRVLEEGSQEIVAEAVISACMKCGMVRGTIVYPLNLTAPRFEVPPGGDIQAEARKALKTR